MLSFKASRRCLLLLAIASAYFTLLFSVAVLFYYVV
jgi:hypothetical protein